MKDELIIIVNKQSPLYTKPPVVKQVIIKLSKNDLKS